MGLCKPDANASGMRRGGVTRLGVASGATETKALEFKRLEGFLAGRKALRGVWMGLVPHSSDGFRSQFSTQFCQFGRRKFANLIIASDTLL